MRRSFRSLEHAHMQVLINGKPTEITPGTSVGDLLEQLELKGKRIAIELNGEILPRSRHAEQRLEEGAQLEIVHAIGGGSASVNNPEIQ